MMCVGCGYPISEPLNEYGKRGFCGRVCYVLFEGWRGNPLMSGEELREVDSNATFSPDESN